MPMLYIGMIFLNVFEVLNLSLAPPPYSLSLRQDNSQPLLLEILPLENETRLDVIGRIQNTLESDTPSRKTV